VLDDGMDNGFLAGIPARQLAEARAQLFQTESIAALDVCWGVVFSENWLPHRIMSGAGFFPIMP